MYTGSVMLGIAACLAALMLGGLYEAYGDESDGAVSECPEREDYTISVKSHPDHPDGSYAGTYAVFYATGACSVTQPVIVMDGLDYTGARGIDYIHEKLTLELSDKLRDQGYDVVVLDFKKGTGFVQNNALVLRELIMDLKSQIGPDGDIVVIGPSMGGVVSRYALAYMEAEGEDHQTRLFVSLDSPHLGANLPLGNQYWISYFSDQNNFAKAMLYGVLRTPAGLQLLLYHEYNQRGMTAGNNGYGNLTIDNPAPAMMFTALQAELDEFGNDGYPAESRNIAIANGAGNGDSYPFGPGDPLIHYESLGSVEIPLVGTPTFDIVGNTWAVSDEGSIFHGKLQLPLIWYDEYEVYVKNAWPYDNAPGSLGDTTLTIAATEPSQQNQLAAGLDLGDITSAIEYESFIPTFSALDIQLPNADAMFEPIDMYSHLSPFDAIYYPDHNQDHLQITPENERWLLCEIFSDDPAALEEHCGDIQQEDGQEAASVPPSDEAGWEVWLSDQSDSYDISAKNPTGTYGSRILIYQGDDILAAPSGTYGEDHPEYGPEVIEAADLFTNARELGVDVKRLHGMLPHPSYQYMNANFFGPGAGLVGIIDAEPDCESSDCPIEAKALFRTTGPEGSQPSNHMSFWTPDGTKLIVGNLGAKLLERIDYDPDTDTFAFNKAATLDLVGGRDLTAMAAAADSTLPAGTVTGEYVNMQPVSTPSGAPKEAAGVRANNVVVCPMPSSNSQHVYVTLGGGGLFVVDTTTEPMSIVAEYTSDIISAAGCGGATDGQYMYLNAGVSASGAGADDSTFVMYRLPLDYPSGPVDTIVPNYPPAIKFYEEKTLDIPPQDTDDLEQRRDAHGLVISPPEVYPSRYLYQFDRIQNNIEVFDTGMILGDPAATLTQQAASHVGTIDLTGSGLCVGDGLPFLNNDGVLYRNDDDPAPDLVDITPDGERLIVSFRGPHPVTVQHAGQGSCPGFGVVTLSGDGTDGELTHVFRTLVPGITGTVNLSDIHAAIVRIQG